MSISSFSERVKSFQRGEWKWVIVSALTSAFIIYLIVKLVGGIISLF